MDGDQNEKQLATVIDIGSDGDNDNQEPPAQGGPCSILLDLMWLIFGGGFIMLLIWFVFGLIGTILLIPSQHSIKLLSITPALLSPTTKYIDFKTVKHSRCSTIGRVFWTIPFGLVLSILHFVFGLLCLPLSCCGIKWFRYHFNCFVAVLDPFSRIVINTNIDRFNFHTDSYDVIKYSNNLSNKVVVITGCNSGLGKETAKHLYSAGCTVIMACRNQSKAEKARDDILQEIKDGNERNIFNIRLDLGDLKTIDEFVQDFNQNEMINGKLDYLIANAGVVAFPEYGTTKDKIGRQFGINYIGHFYLINKLLPVLRRNKTRIISISSAAQAFWGEANAVRDFLNGNVSNMGPSPDTVPYDPFKYYGLSKLCTVLFTRYLNKLYNNDGIVALCLNPGNILTTGAGRHMAVGINAMKAMMFNIGFWTQFVKSKSMAQGTASTIRCVTISNKEIFGGDNFNDIDNMVLYIDDCMKGNHKVNEAFVNNKNTEMDQLLWDYSCKIIQSLDYLSLNE